MARICMIAYADYPSDTRVRCEAEALVERGDEVDIVCPRSDALGDTREIGGVRLHPVTSWQRVGGAGPLYYVRQYLAFLLAATYRVGRLHLKRRFDLVEAHTMPDFLAFTALIPKLLGAKVILDVHDLMPELYESKFGLPASHWLIRGLTLAERLSVRFADRAIAVHVPHLAALERHGNPAAKFEIVMNVPDPRFFRRRDAAPAHDRFVLVYHGMVGTRNGLDMAVRAIAIARDEVPEIELRIIGDGDDFPRVRAVVDELGVQDHVRLEQGMRPVEQVVPLIVDADAGIVPIIDDSFTQYMLPVKLLEYVAMGIPTIVSRTATVQAYFDDHMVSFATPGDPADLAARIVELHHDPELRAARLAAAERFNTEHSWDRERDTYYTLVDSLLGRATPDPATRQATNTKMEVGTR